MSDMGYLQTKIRENQTKINKLKNLLFESQTNIRILKQDVENKLKNAEKFYNDVKNLLDTFDYNKINATVDVIVNRTVKKYSGKVFKDFDTLMNKYKQVDKETLAKLEQTLLKEQCNQTVGMLHMVLESIIEHQVAFHNILFKNKLIKKPFNSTWVCVQNLYGDDILLNVNWEGNDFSVKRGKNVAKKFTNKKILRTDNPRQPTVRIRSKPFDGKIIGSLE